MLLLGVSSLRLSCLEGGFFFGAQGGARYLMEFFHAAVFCNICPPRGTGYHVIRICSCTRFGCHVFDPKIGGLLGLLKEPKGG
jgi:hypothetical protein